MLLVLTDCMLTLMHVAMTTVKTDLLYVTKTASMHASDDRNAVDRPGLTASSVIGHSVTAALRACRHHGQRRSLGGTRPERGTRPPINIYLIIYPLCPPGTGP